MPFERPTLDELRAQAQADLAAALPGSDPLLPVSNLGILADLLAEGFNAENAYLDWISRQAVPFTATDEAFEGWAGLKGVSRKAATTATGVGTWTAVVGTLLPAGTAVVRSDGVPYVTTADATAGGGGTVIAPIEALDAGSAGTLVAGVSVVISQAIAGIASAGTAQPTAPGADVETFDAFRTRVLDVYASPPQGGAANDYVEWALQIAAVTRAWCVRNGQGPGTVVVYFMMDVSEVAHGGFPQGTNGVAALEPRDAAATGDQRVVADYIFDLQPVTALVYAYAPAKNTVTFTITLPGASVELKAQVSAAIDGTFLTYGAPGGTVNNSDVEAAISVLPGTAGFVITAEACDHGVIAPTNGNITSAAGYLPVRGLITWA